MLGFTRTIKFYKLYTMKKQNVTHGTICLMFAQAVFILAPVPTGFAVFKILMKMRWHHNNYQNSSTS